MEVMVEDLAAAAARHDIPNSPGNGYWSLIRVVHCCLEKLLQRARSITAERNSVFFHARARQLGEAVGDYRAILGLLKEMLLIALFLADRQRHPDPPTPLPPPSPLPSPTSTLSPTAAADPLPATPSPRNDASNPVGRGTGGEVGGDAAQASAQGNGAAGEDGVVAVSLQPSEFGSGGAGSSDDRNAGGVGVADDGASRGTSRVPCGVGAAGMFCANVGMDELRELFERLDLSPMYGRHFGFQYPSRLRHFLRVVVLATASYSRGFRGAAAAADDDRLLAALGPLLADGNKDGGGGINAGLGHGLAELARSGLHGVSYALRPEDRGAQVAAQYARRDVEFAKAFWNLTELPIATRFSVVVAPLVEVNRLIDIDGTSPLRVPRDAAAAAAVATLEREDEEGVEGQEDVFQDFVEVEIGPSEEECALYCPFGYQPPTTVRARLISYRDRTVAAHADSPGPEAAAAAATAAAAAAAATANSATAAASDAATVAATAATHGGDAVIAAATATSEADAPPRRRGGSPGLASLLLSAGGEAAAGKASGGLEGRTASGGATTDAASSAGGGAADWVWAHAAAAAAAAAASAAAVSAAAVAAAGGGSGGSSIGSGAFGGVGFGGIGGGRELSPFLVLHFHGGGFIAQSSASHEVYLRDWAKTLDAPILSIDYGLSPEHPFPVAVCQCFYAYCWARQHARQLGSTGRSVVLVGDSAGGNLAAAVALRAAEEGIAPPAGVCMLYPALLLSLVPSPSRVLSLMDPLLPLGNLEVCVNAYAEAFSRAYPDQLRRALAHPDQNPFFEAHRPRRRAQPEAAAVAGGRSVSHSPEELAGNGEGRAGESASAARRARARRRRRLFYHLSPLTAPSWLLRALPACGVMASELDPLLDDAVSFVARMRVVGRELDVKLRVAPLLPHGWLNMYFLGDRRVLAASAEAVGWMKQMLHNGLHNQPDSKATAGGDGGRGGSSLLLSSSPPTLSHQHLQTAVSTACTIAAGHDRNGGGQQGQSVRRRPAPAPPRGGEALWAAAASAAAGGGWGMDDDEEEGVEEVREIWRPDEMSTTPLGEQQG